MDLDSWVVGLGDGLGMGNGYGYGSGLMVLVYGARQGTRGKDFVMTIGVLLLTATVLETLILNYSPS